MKLANPLPDSTSAEFGASIALDAAGLFAVVGATSSSMANGAWVYHREDRNWRSPWTLQSTLRTAAAGSGTGLGCNVDLNDDGRTAVVASLSGKVYLFERTTFPGGQGQPTVDEWSSEGSELPVTFKLPPLDEPALLGTSACALSLSNSGTVVVVGSPGESTMAGAVFVLSRPSTASDAWTMHGKFESPNKQSGHQFGRSVSVDASGDTILIGEPFKGAVYLLLHAVNAAIEPEIKKLEVSEALVDPVQALVGWSVSINPAGTIAAVGAPRAPVRIPQDNEILAECGNVFVFEDWNTTPHHNARLVSPLCGIEGNLSSPTSQPHAHHHVGITVTVSDSSATSEPIIVASARPGLWPNTSASKEAELLVADEEVQRPYLAAFAPNHKDEELTGPTSWNTRTTVETPSWVFKDDSDNDMFAHMPVQLSADGRVALWGLPAFDSALLVDGSSCFEPGTYNTMAWSSLSCAFCLPGSSAPEGFTSDCELCPAGTFASEFGAANCTECDTNTYAAGAGSSSCTPCPTGSCSTQGSATCSATLCPDDNTGDGGKDDDKDSNEPSGSTVAAVVGTAFGVLFLVLGYFYLKRADSGQAGDDDDLFGFDSGLGSASDSASAGAFTDPGDGHEYVAMT